MGLSWGGAKCFRQREEPLRSPQDRNTAGRFKSRFEWLEYSWVGGPGSATGDEGRARGLDSE